jgi:hypothetical protein
VNTHAKLRNSGERTKEMWNFHRIEVFVQIFFQWHGNF